MHYLLVAIGLLSAPLGALALTWDFDEGHYLGLDGPRERL